MVSNEGLVCPKEGCGKPLGNLSVAAQLEAQIRQHQARYYSAYLVCDDPACGNRTRQMSVYGHRCLGPKGRGTGCLGKMSFEYGDKALYNQLLYLQSLFDVDRAKEKVKKSGKGEEGEKVEVLAELNRERFGTLMGVVKGYLDRNGRQWVSMDSIFSFALKAV